MKSDLLDPLAEEPQNPCVVVVRVVTSHWRDKRGVHLRRSLNYLKRHSKGENFLDEDAAMIGAGEAISRIQNLASVRDGIYKVITCNERRDWETGDIEDWDFMLVPFEVPTKKEGK